MAKIQFYPPDANDLKNVLPPYLQDERGFIYMKTKPDTGFLKFPEYHPICHVGQDLELFKVFDKKLFTMMCDEIDLDVIEVKQDTKNT
ncbi:hypothetical protein FBU59_002174 [Linderina macrospora]|uniref:Uncharacterized protein n=1 Tax=Linderina macrospora TaxID=4868 RepID=A0ACC1JC38_9FUNG|nr:hypothetical protein FBU59_002174 [Linderina macrospora]